MDLGHGKARWASSLASCDKDAPDRLAKWDEAARWKLQIATAGVAVIDNRPALDHFMPNKRNALFTGPIGPPNLVRMRLPRLPRTLFLLAACTLTACSSRDADGGADTSSPAIPAIAPQPDTTAQVPVPRGPRPPLTPARDADQDFLRHMLDHHETVLVTVHAEMMEPAKHAEHGTASDPVELDGQLDKEKLEMLAMLKQYYGEDYSPWAATTVPASTEHSTAGSPRPMPADMAHDSMPGIGAKAPSPLAAQLREGAALAQRLAPTLTRPAVRALALRIRASHLAMAKKVDEASTP